MKADHFLSLDPNEEVLTRIKRHRIGYVAIIVASSLGVLLSVILMMLAINNRDALDIDLSNAVYVSIFSIFIVLAVLFGVISTYVYSRNEIVITNENIIQIRQFGLFTRQVSQLNLAKVQDVTADQIGVFAHMFNYGTLEVETAGEAANFKFLYTPDAGRVSKLIIEAHQNYVGHGKNTGDGV